VIYQRIRMETYKKIDDLEKIVKRQGQMINDLSRKIALLERENNRRKNEMTQVAAAINGK
jgi:prefoldin subunit 5